MEKSSPNFSWEQDLKINVEVEKCETQTTEVFNSIEVPDLSLRDNLRILNSKHVKIY